MVEGIDRIDWSRPWLAPYRECGLQAAALIEAGASVAQALDAQRNQRAAQATPLRFVEPNNAPADESYESTIARTSSVPTRDNLHDFFNGLVWLHFPQLKWRLNRMHAEHVARHGISTTRGPLRDALTLFDENAALLSAPSSLLDALHARAWRRLFIDERDAWQHATLVLFGHALLEKLVHPRKEITAHVWVMPGGIESIEDERLQPPTVKAFSVLPVLGVPGWWPANEDVAFYEDAAVFRAPRAQPGRNPSIDRYRSPES